MSPEALQETGTIGLAVYVLVEIFKRAGLPSRYAALASLGLGLAIGLVAFIVQGKPWFQGLIEGFWASASASGVYSGAKATFTPKTVSMDDDPALHPNC